MTNIKVLIIQALLLFCAQTAIANNIRVQFDEITVEEVKAVLSKMRLGKTCGDDWSSCRRLPMCLNDLLGGASPTPKSWGMNRIVVLFKKGDAAEPCNHRPMSILPVLYKAFSGVLLGRVRQ